MSTSKHKPRTAFDRDLQRRLKDEEFAKAYQAELDELRDTVDGRMETAYDSGYRDGQHAILKEMLQAMVNVIQDIETGRRDDD